MNKNELSRSFFRSCEMMHDAIDDLYNNILHHDDGSPIVRVDKKTDAALKSSVRKMHIEYDMIRAILKEVENI